MGRLDSSAVEKAEKAAEEAKATIEKFKRAARAEIGLGQ
jgi:sRNA-binding protein